MIRLLTAALLVASFHAVAEVTLTPLNNNTPADADDVMGNFNALKNEIESLPTPPTNCSTDQIIKWDGTEWVCSWPANASGFAFKYVFNPATDNYLPGEFSIAWSDADDPANPTRSDVYYFRLSYVTETGLDLHEYFDTRYSSPTGSVWITVRSASDPTDITLYEVASGTIVTPTFLLVVKDRVIPTNPDSTFISGETYIIEFQ